MAGFGFDVGRHLRVHRIALAIRVERYATIFAELGLLKLGPGAEVAYAEAAQQLANMLERGRFIGFRFGAKQGPDDAVGHFVIAAGGQPDPVFVDPVFAVGRDGRLEGCGLEIKRMGEEVHRRLNRVRPDPSIGLATVSSSAKDRAFWSDRERVDALAGFLAQPNVKSTVVDDKEHQAFGVQIDDQTAGYSRRHRLDLDFVTTGEFRTLAAAYDEVREFMVGVVTIRTTKSAATEEAADLEETPDETNTAPRDDAEAPKAAPVKADKGGDTRVESLDELAEYFVAAGRRGLAVNRYKGLGEMNPDTLWETTMDPGKRTLLEVRAEDHTEADLMFTTLVGDQVEIGRAHV